MNKVVNAYILFDQLHLIANISDLLGSLDQELNIFKLIDIQQLIVHEPDENEVNILISEWEFVDKLQDFDINKGLYNKIIVIDNENKTPEQNDIEFIQKNFFYTQLENIFLRISHQIKAIDLNYIPVNIERVLNKEFPFDFYIKLSEEKYIKIINKNEQIDTQVFSKYKDVKFFYIEEKYWNDFLYFIKSPITSISEITEPKEELIQAVSPIHDYVKLYGIDKKVIKKTVELQKNIQKNYNKKVIKSLFKKLNSTKGTYLYDHSFFTSILCLEVGKKFDWMSEENFEKLYIASMFHDLGYMDQNNAVYEDYQIDKVNMLPNNIKEDILGHTTTYIAELEKTKIIHPDIIRMIKEHHGVHGNQSYPKQVYAQEINLIFALFILCHEFSIDIVRAEKDTDSIIIILENIKEKYNKGNYKRVINQFIESVESIFLK